MSDTISFTLKTAAGQILPAMAGVLAKAEAHARAIGVEEQVLLNYRLVPDMFPMGRQVNVATDIMARGSARLAGTEVPALEDDETSFAELIARANTRLSHVAALDDAALNADPDGMITFPVGPTEMTLPRKAYCMTFIIPNFFFHASMTYGLLRAQGVELGKMDFLQGPQG